MPAQLSFILRSLVLSCGELAVVALLLMITIDTVLLTTFDGYQTSGSYVIPILVFYLATYSLSWVGLRDD